MPGLAFLADDAREPLEFFGDLLVETDHLVEQHSDLAILAAQILVEPDQYLNRKWPEFWLTHANIDKLWAAGIPIKWRVHTGLTHMKTLVTSTYATNGSSNFAAAWQRDDTYFISATGKPAIYQAIKNRVTGMWNDAISPCA